MTPKKGRGRRDPRTLARLRARLTEAEETLRAILAGDVDAVVVAGEGGPRVFTLESAEHDYRVLIESMNEGALTLSDRMVVLYANQCFAKMVGCPLEKLIGGSFDRFVSADDLAALRPLLRRPRRSDSKIQGMLQSGDGSRMPVQISVQSLTNAGPDASVIGMVVTDLTEARRSEEALRALFHRLARSQEAERGRVALELHDHITQLLCAVLIRSQALADGLSARDGPAKAEAMKLREMLGRTAEEVERISRGLRPSVLDQLGLVAVLRGTCKEFADRNGVPVDLACEKLSARLPAETELAIFRIFQEAMRNVEQHARARRVTVGVTHPGSFVELSVEDDGIGFDPELGSTKRRKGRRGLGLLGMGERAAYVAGSLTIESVRGEGTTIRVRVPSGDGAPATEMSGTPRSRRRRPA